MSTIILLPDENRVASIDEAVRLFEAGATLYYKLASYKTRQPVVAMVSKENAIWIRDYANRFCNTKKRFGTGNSPFSISYCVDSGDLYKTKK